MTRKETRNYRRIIERVLEGAEDVVSAANMELDLLQKKCKHPKSRNFKRNKGISKCKDCGAYFKEKKKK